MRFWYSGCMRYCNFCIHYVKHIHSKEYFFQSQSSFPRSKCPYQHYKSPKITLQMIQIFSKICKDLKSYMCLNLCAETRGGFSRISAQRATLTGYGSHLWWFCCVLTCSVSKVCPSVSWLQWDCGQLLRFSGLLLFRNAQKTGLKFSKLETDRWPRGNKLPFYYFSYVIVCEKTQNKHCKPTTWLL